MSHADLLTEPRKGEMKTSGHGSPNGPLVKLYLPAWRDLAHFATKRPVTSRGGSREALRLRCLLGELRAGEYHRECVLKRPDLIVVERHPQRRQWTILQSGSRPASTLNVK